MRVFFDNCTSHVLAATLNGFLAHRGDDAVHLKDLPCGRHAADIEWMAYLSSDRRRWLVVTGDLRIQRNRAERRAYRQAGLRGIALAPAYQDFPVQQQAAFILWRWDDIEAITRLTAPPFLFELPARRSSRLRALPV